MGASEEPRAQPDCGPGPEPIGQTPQQDTSEQKLLGHGSEDHCSRTDQDGTERRQATKQLSGWLRHVEIDASRDQWDIHQRDDRELDHNSNTNSPSSVAEGNPEPKVSTQSACPKPSAGDGCGDEEDGPKPDLANEESGNPLVLGAGANGECGSER